MDLEVKKRERTYQWTDPSVTANAGRTRGELEFLQAIANGKVPFPPILETMFDRNATEIEQGKVMFFLQPQEFHYNPIGSVHGGVIATLLDTAVGCAVHSTLPAGVGYTTLEIKVNYMRPMTIKTRMLRCEGKMLSAGRTVAVAEGRLFDSQGKLYAHATTTCLILRSEQS